jgi:hypothetical protein
LKPAEMASGGNNEKTIEKREEQVFIAGRIGTLHYSLQAGGERGGNIVPSKRISKSPIGISGDIGREGHKGDPWDLRWVLSSKADREMGARGRGVPL